MDKRFLFAAILLASIVVSSAKYVDELKVSEECLGEDIECTDGGCISHDKYCDGVYDCKDGWDEGFCGPRKFPAKCNSTHQHLCKDKSMCIGEEMLCDNKTDCTDGSDEKQCTRIDLMIKAMSKKMKGCKGFACDDGKCISNLWICDGREDCFNGKDEINKTLCKIIKEERVNKVYDVRKCNPQTLQSPEYFQCDSAYCLPKHKVCDGEKNCRDGSDEGPYCDKWTTMCANFTCNTEGAGCRETPAGPRCKCPLYMISHNANNSCIDRDDCALVVPECSQRCENFYKHFKCSCDEGYYTDTIGTYQCFASDPEGILFYTTSRDIRYYTLKTKAKKIAVDVAKQPHGVTYDGTYLYWIENAQGYESILRAKLNDTAGTKQVILALGLEEPGNLAIDWIGQHVYFTDVARGHIGVCNMNGTMCTILNTKTKNPNYVTLHPQVGDMYWSDWYKESPVIMRAKMDGSNASVFLDGLQQVPTGLTLDLPSGRMYFADKDIYVVMLNSGKSEKLLSEEKTHAFSLAVFENMVYWSDWRTNSIQASTKIQPRSTSRKILVTSPVPCYGIHIFHPLLMKPQKNPCENSNCSHMCLLNGNGTFVCACPEGRTLVNGTCVPIDPDEEHQYLIIGGGQKFAKIHYNWLGNPAELITFNIGYVQAMAFDNTHRVLYLYDGIHKAIKYIHFDDFSKGETKVLLYRGLINVVDMDYDYVSNSLYFVDASRRIIEVISLRTRSRTIIHNFKDYEIPISICVIPDYGRLMVALIEHEQNNDIHIDTMGLDGKERRHILQTGLKGPRISLRYSPEMDSVFISDEGSGIIQYIHPTGTGKEEFRSLATTVTSLAISDGTVFWTDRRTPRLFWANIHESQKIRRLELTLYPNYTQIHLQATSLPPDLNSPLMQHPCFKKQPCSDICVQTAHRTIHEVTMEHYMGYTCLCPSGFLLKGEKCVAVASCEPKELYCHSDNTCVKGKSCDGVKECPNGEDEINCEGTTEAANIKCHPGEVLCYGVCTSNNVICTENASNTTKTVCDRNEFQCESSICLQRWERCNGEKDCPDGSDETNCEHFECFDFEYRCASGSCIPIGWKCDKDSDCADGSDEVNCFNRTCDEGMFQCMSGHCIDISKRCDAQNDCLDFTDEQDCIDENVNLDDIEDLEEKCEDHEYTCVNNRSICLPYSARCDGNPDCPDSSDETECDPYCPKSLGHFRCDHDTKCLQSKQKCDGQNHCDDKTDETDCANETETSTTTVSPVSKLQCKNGFVCGSGQCIQWDKACDRKIDCTDGSDEGPNCAKACDDHDCDFTCQATPAGGICLCPQGFKMDLRLKRCVDIDECAAELCSQKCYNVMGSFFCGCHRGYALRSNQRTCKAVHRNMMLSYLDGTEIYSMNRFVGPLLEWNATTIVPSLTDFDMNIRKNTFYVICRDTGELLRVELNQTDYTFVSNIGKPAKVTLDWITDNVYLVDSSPSEQRIKVCNLEHKRCANLQKLPKDAQVKALAVDPANGRMFYCLNLAMETVVWSASLAGHQAKDLLNGHHCTGLALDSFKKRVYIAQHRPDSIIQIDYDGNSLKLVDQLSTQLFFRSPNDLALFEDSLYFRHADSSIVCRCSLFGSKLCEPMIFRGHDTTKFLVKHESMQRDDVVNLCENALCSSVCVLTYGAPQCVCADGTLTTNGSDCRMMEDKDMPYFKFPEKSISTETNNVTGTVFLSLLCFVILIVLAFFLFRKYKKRTMEPRQPIVRFQNTLSSPLTDEESPEEPTVQIPEHTNQHEFINPIQIFRNVWRRSRQRQRPLNREISIEEPSASAQTASSSDTESLGGQDSRTTLVKEKSQRETQS